MTTSPVITEFVMTAPLWEKVPAGMLFSVVPATTPVLPASGRGVGATAAALAFGAARETPMRRTMVVKALRGRVLSLDVDIEAPASRAWKEVI
jgi:hypothetical protein